MRLLLFTALIILGSCQSDEKMNGHAKLEIQAIMNQQEDAWNAGDLNAFMEPYWKSDSLLFIGSRGPTFGWQTTLNNYKKTYPTPEKMGRLKFENLTMKPLENAHYWVAGKWILYRQADTLAGHYTLLWKHTKTGWKIITDHSS